MTSLFTSNGFLSAQDARNIALNTVFLLAEIQAVETAILTAVDANQLSATVTTSAMTTSTVYFNVFQNTVVDKVKSLQMQTVLDYFTNLGYAIIQLQNTITGNTFEWSVQW